MTGTVFDVRSETTNQLDVTVVEGSVQVRPGESAKNPESEPYLLKHNDALVSEGSGATVHSLSNSELSDTLAWRDGLVVADGLTLTEAIAQFARYHGQGITVTEAASRTRIGGRYNIDDIEGFLTDIQQQYPVKVSHEANGTIRVSAGSATLVFARNCLHDSILDSHRAANLGSIPDFPASYWQSFSMRGTGGTGCVRFAVGARRCSPSRFLSAGARRGAVFFRPASLRVPSVAVEGSYEPADAIALLLSKSGFIAQKNTKGRFLVVEAPKPPGSIKGKLVITHGIYRPRRTSGTSLEHRVSGMSE